MSKLHAHRRARRRGLHATRLRWLWFPLCSCLLACSGSRGLAPVEEPAWRQLDVSTPGPCVGSAMVWDPVRGVFVMHGGQDVSWNMRPETWEWSPSSHDWRLVVGASEPSPGKRTMHAMVWDSTWERMIFFGGMIDDVFFDDTWAFDGAVSRWVQLETTGTPPARSQHGMAYDPVGDQVVIFGGRGPNMDPLHDTWVLDLTTYVWAEVDPDQRTPHPRARDHVQMARDPLSGIIVMRGCFMEEGFPDETWHFDAHAKNWSLSKTQTEPHGLDHGFLCPLERLGGLALFGFSGRYNHDPQTWLYRPLLRTWTQLRGRGEEPEAPCDHGQAASNGRYMFLLGGFLEAPPSSESGVIPRGATWRL